VAPNVGEQTGLQKMWNDIKIRQNVGVVQWTSSKVNEFANTFWLNTLDRNLLLGKES
jgi:hypothetical protein